MATVYNASSMQALVLKEIQVVTGVPEGTFNSTSSLSAYDEAVRECGFSCPAETDDDAKIKYQWLVQRMRRYFMWQLLQKYILQFKSGDADAQGMVKNLENIIKKLDEAFEKAKADLAGLFGDIAYFGTDLVLTTGLIEDRVGESTEDRT